MAATISATPCRAPHETAYTLKKPSSSGLPLSMVSSGQTVRVRSIGGKDAMRMFLKNLGFVEEAPVTVVSELSGNVIVNIKDTRIAISKAMAARVLTA